MRTKLIAYAIVLLATGILSTDNNNPVVNSNSVVINGSLAANIALNLKNDTLGLTVLLKQILSIKADFSGSLLDYINSFSKVNLALTVLNNNANILVNLANNAAVYLTNDQCTQLINLAAALNSNANANINGGLNAQNNANPLAGADPQKALDAIRNMAGSPFGNNFAFPSLNPSVGFNNSNNAGVGANIPLPNLPNMPNLPNLPNLPNGIGSNIGGMVNNNNNANVNVGNGAFGLLNNFGNNGVNLANGLGGNAFNLANGALNKGLDAAGNVNAGALNFLNNVPDKVLNGVNNNIGTGLGAANAIGNGALSNLNNTINAVGNVAQAIPVTGVATSALNTAGNLLAPGVATAANLANNVAQNAANLANNALNTVTDPGALLNLASNAANIALGAVNSIRNNIGAGANLGGLGLGFNASNNTQFGSSINA